MNNIIIYFGFFYILIGTLFLFIPIIYLELGRPKDLIRAFFNLLIGFISIIKNKTFDESLFTIYVLLTLLIIFYVTELFLFRWNQLTDKEKEKLTTFLELRKNLSKILEAINLEGVNYAKPLNLFTFKRNNQKIGSKKWVRNDKNDNIKV